VRPQAESLLHQPGHSPPDDGEALQGDQAREKRLLACPREAFPISPPPHTRRAFRRSLSEEGSGFCSSGGYFLDPPSGDESVNVILRGPLSDFS
jgi:hypothetical protein